MKNTSKHLLSIVHAVALLILSATFTSHPGCAQSSDSTSKTTQQVKPDTRSKETSIPGQEPKARPQSKANEPSYSLQGDINAYLAICAQEDQTRKKISADSTRLAEMEKQNAFLYDSLRSIDMLIPLITAEESEVAKKEGKSGKSRKLAKAGKGKDSVHVDTAVNKSKVLSNLYKQRTTLASMFAGVAKKLPIAESQLDSLYSSLDEIRARKRIIIDSARRAVNRANGAVNFKRSGCMYFGYLVDEKKDRMELHWLNPVTNQPFVRFSDLNAYLVKNKDKVLMITNAGMYTPENAPQGLFVEKKKLERHIDTLRKVEEGNFYMQPNGVFWIDAKGDGHIDRTETFTALHLGRNKTPNPEVLYATQSGPMLVHGNRINKNFTKDSPNSKIRSGVGVTDDGRTIFLCTRDGETFYNFSCLFRDVFGCRQALFLDGAISKMYLPGKNPGLDVGPFGPIISILKAE